MAAGQPAGRYGGSPAPYRRRPEMEGCRRLAGRQPVASRVVGPDDITPAWLSEVLGLDVVAATPERVGTGQVGMSVRYRLAYAGEPPAGAPASVVAKLPSPDDGEPRHGRAAPELRAGGRVLPGGGGHGRHPHAPLLPRRLGPEATGDFVLVLEDLAPAVQGDQIDGLHRGRRPASRSTSWPSSTHPVGPTRPSTTWSGSAAAARSDGANLQALYQMLWPGFVERYEQYLTPEQLALGEWFGSQIEAGSASAQPPYTVTHGDYRLDNMMFGTAEGGLPARRRRLADAGPPDGRR